MVPDHAGKLFYHQFDECGSDIRGCVLSAESMSVIINPGSGSGGGTNPLYIGDPNTDGSWRFYDDGTNLIVQRREGGIWVEKDRFYHEKTSHSIVFIS